jgi:hypothetical protein
LVAQHQAYQADQDEHHPDYLSVDTCVHFSCPPLLANVSSCAYVEVKSSDYWLLGGGAGKEH